MTPRQQFSLSVFKGELEKTLARAVAEGPTVVGTELCRRGALMVDSVDFEALPDDDQDELFALYSQALFRVTGGLM